VVVRLVVFARTWVFKPTRRRIPRRGPPEAQTAIISARVGRLIAIGTFGTRDEAEVVQGLLASAGIGASIRADDAGGAYPFVLSGGAQVLVDESDATAASELLAAPVEQPAEPETPPAPSEEDEDQDTDD
jgi:hypothetical protein